MRPHAKVVLQVLAHRTTLLSLACLNVTSCYCHPLRKNIHISLLFSKLWSLTFPGTLVRTLTVITRNTVFHFSLTFSLHSPRIYSFWLSHQAWHMSHTSTLCSSNSSTTRVSVQECTLFITGVNVYLSCEHFVHLHGVSSCIFHYVPIFIWSNVL